MKRWKPGRHRLIAISAALMIWAAPAWAETPDAEPQPAPASRPDAAPFDAALTQRFEAPEAIHVGDPLELTLELTHPRDVQVIPPAETGTSRVSIADADIRTSAGESASVTTTLRLTLVPLRVGTVNLGEMPVTLSDRGGEGLTLNTEPLELKILSNLPADAEPSLEPARPPVPIFTEDYGPLWIGLGGAGVLLGLLLVGGLLRRRLGAEVELEPDAPEHVVALERLRALERDGLLERGDVFGFYTRMSEIVREYLGRRHGFPGTELTTTEILACLEQVELPPSLGVPELRDWLRACDRVKFLGVEPAHEEAEAALRKAFSVVELTRRPDPAPDAEEDAAAPAAPKKISVPRVERAVALETRFGAAPLPAASESSVEEADASEEELEQDAPVEDAPAPAEDAEEEQEEQEEQEPADEARAEQLASSALGSLGWEALTSVVEELEDEGEGEPEGEASEDGPDEEVRS